VRLTRAYSFDLAYNNLSTGVQEFATAPTPYRFVIENYGIENPVSRLLKVTMKEA